MKLYPGCTENFKIPKRGKFAVMRNKAEGKESVFYVRYFKVEDDWSIKINVDEENQHKTKVYRVLEDKSEQELVPGETKEFSTENGNRFDFASGGNYFSGLCTVIAAIIESCA